MLPHLVFVVVASSPPLIHALYVVSWTWAPLISLPVVAHCPSSISSLTPSSLSAPLPLLLETAVPVVVVVVVMAMVRAVKRAVSSPPSVVSLHSSSPAQVPAQGRTATHSPLELAPS